jgi:hypothetical protein
LRKTLFRKIQAEANQAEGLTSHYQRGWDEDGMADSRDTAVDIPGSAASTRASANWPETNWKRCASSPNIIFATIIRGSGSLRNPQNREQGSTLVIGGRQTIVLFDNPANSA